MIRNKSRLMTLHAIHSRTSSKLIKYDAKPLNRRCADTGQDYTSKFKLSQQMQ